MPNHPILTLKFNLKAAINIQKLKYYVEYFFFIAAKEKAGLDTAEFTPQMSGFEPTGQTGVYQGNPSFECDEITEGVSTAPLSDSDNGVIGSDYTAIISATNWSTWPNGEDIYLTNSSKTWVGLHNLGNGTGGIPSHDEVVMSERAWNTATGWAGTTPPVVAALSPNGEVSSDLTHYGSLEVPCFMFGTIFSTLRGREVPTEVQKLHVGDLVKTEVFVNQKGCQFSQEGWQRIKKICVNGLTPEFYAETVRILPKDVFGEGKPEKDLHMTWGHGLLLKEMKDEWKNEEYDKDYEAYSKNNNLVKGDYSKLLAGHCSLCRRPNEEEKKKAAEEPFRRVHYHIEIDDNEEKSQHALLTHGQTSESLLL